MSIRYESEFEETPGFGRGSGYLQASAQRLAVTWVLVMVGSTVSVAGGAWHNVALFAVGALTWCLGVGSQYGLAVLARRSSSR